MPIPIKLYDSYLKTDIIIDPQTTVLADTLKMYSCGPTVYGYQHIGNMRAVWLADTIVKTAKSLGWNTEWVLNITDVGHLVGDGDEGKNIISSEDKMEKTARLTGKTVGEIVSFYTNDYLSQTKALHLDLPRNMNDFQNDLNEGVVNPKASEWIKEQMVLALELLEDGKAYLLEDGIYFDSIANKDLIVPFKIINNFSINPEIITKYQKIWNYLKLNQKPTKADIIIVGGSQDLETVNYAIDLYKQGIASKILFTGGYGKYTKNWTETEAETFAKIAIEKGVNKDDILIEKESKNTGENILFAQKILENTPSVTHNKIILIHKPYMERRFLNTFLKQWTLDYNSVTVTSQNISFEEYLTQNKTHPNPKSFLQAILLDFAKIKDYSGTHQINDIIEDDLWQVYEELLILINTDENYTGRELKNVIKNPADFAVWKFVPENTLQKWKFYDVPEAVAVLSRCVVEGRIMNMWGCPGWHSECVAMIAGILGRKLIKSRKKFTFVDFVSASAIIDLHLGGEDHIDIHHKNEILQSEALGFHLSKYWVHNKFVLVDGKKMSKSTGKSLGNLYLVQGDPAVTGFDSLVSLNYDPLAYRLMMFEHHYTTQLDFTFDKLAQSQARLFGLRKEVAKIVSFQQNFGFSLDFDMEITSEIKAPFMQILADGLNTPKFVDSFQVKILEMVNGLVKDELDENDYRTIVELHQILKLDLWKYSPEKVKKLATERWEAKQSKNWAKADELRLEIESRGWMVDDYKWGFGLWFNPTAKEKLVQIV